MEAPPLFDAMRRDIEARCRAIDAAAEAEAARLIDEAHARADARQEETLAAVREELATAEARARDRARARAEREELMMEQRVADETLAAVRERLTAAAEGPGGAAVMEALLAELAPRLTPEMEVHAPAAHAEACARALWTLGHSEVEVKPDPELTDGVAAQDAARTRRILNTLGARFDRLEPALRRACIERLFGGSSAP
jgi:vacuolar-type H+-ATPase subunit E/Vma4